MTKIGIKPEYYREVTPYWCSRLLLSLGKKKSMKYWEGLLDIGYDNINDCIENIAKLSTFATFKTNTVTIGTGNPEWGAEPDKLYFIIKHGEQIK